MSHEHKLAGKTAKRAMKLDVTFDRRKAHLITLPKKRTMSGKLATS